MAACTGVHADGVSAPCCDLFYLQKYVFWFGEFWEDTKNCSVYAMNPKRRLEAAKGDVSGVVTWIYVMELTSSTYHGRVS